MAERKLIPYNPNRLPPEKADLQIDGADSDFLAITARSGFAGVDRMMVERDGTVLYDTIKINPSSGVFVLPVRINPHKQAEYLLVNEWKDKLGKRITQIPQGRVGDGETDAEAAKREIREETGHEPTDLVLVGRQVFDSAYMSKEQPFYLALVPYDQERQDLELEGGEDIEKLHWMRPEEIRRLPISDGKTTIGIALAERVLNPNLL
jgi:8-oxo-dGTP pyrophosphatase MutT (NUDIX family)